jgi:hypothetical protein
MATWNSPAIFQKPYTENKTRIPTYEAGVA